MSICLFLFRPSIHLKGKSAIWLAQNIDNRKRNFADQKLWVRGYFVSTVVADEAIIQAYIRNQEKQDQTGQFKPV